MIHIISIITDQSLLPAISKVFEKRYSYNYMIIKMKMNYYIKVNMDSVLNIKMQLHH